MEENPFLKNQNVRAFDKIAFLARLFEEHGELLQYPRRQRENIKVFGASNVEACHSLNIRANIWHECSLGV